MDKIIGFTLLIIIVGVLLGTSFADLNPWTSPAQARKMDAETIYQTQLNEMAIKEKELELLAKARQYEQDRIQDQEIHAQLMVNNQRLADAGIIMINIFGGALSISVIIVAIRITAPKKVTATPIKRCQPPKPTIGNSTRVRVLPIRQPDAPWDSPTYQKNVIQQAYDNERLSQNDPLVNARLHSACDSSSRMRIVGKERYYSMPRGE